VSAAIFARIRAELGGLNVFMAFLLGLIAAWLYEHSSSIIPAIALPAAWNTAITLTLAGIHAA
jgi:membrane protease YdiL (CAAX protease family)